MAPPELTAPRAASVALAWNNQESTLGRRDALAQAAVDGELDAGSSDGRVDGRGIVLYITRWLSKAPTMKSSERLNFTYSALADPTRRAILARLAAGEASVQELAEPFAMSQPAISKHLKVLERAGLVSVNVDAQRRPRRLVPKRLNEAVDWIERCQEVFEQNYRRLDGLLEELQAEHARPKKQKR